MNDKLHHEVNSAVSAYFALSEGGAPASVKDGVWIWKKRESAYIDIYIYIHIFSELSFTNTFYADISPSNLFL